ncbi:monovalent cation/H(+) antiporter subunit G [Modestobacter sp. VKM Ac-2985]|uniref:monovalent cation/H(+) antiporter subunit G n=1 Tax=Modestobacter sp. VKM Ac-2985 TaxID=3004139 RepID=UPI0022AB9A0D|nr:monovalent cation/H(+) antiporter subunit G [Modestobacter sp. VKM Ac-2985]MCZ2838674.1 monovalent cation/H(+) antiporter subunit G [Modestobacter sp. VKM Ac-2985]
MTLQSVLGQGLAVLGVLLIGAAGVGLVRLPDVYNRANAATKAASLGLVCVLFGVVVLAPGVSAVVTLLVAIALQLFTVPIAGYKIAEAAHRSGAPLAPATVRDERDAPGPEDDTGGT